LLIEPEFTLEGWTTSLSARLRISANVTGDFGNVTDFDRMLGCAKRIVGMGSV
jgi:hypothetical protein